MGFVEIFANAVLVIFGIGGVNFTINLNQINYFILIGSFGFILLAIADSLKLILHDKHKKTI